MTNSNVQVLGRLVHNDNVEFVLDLTRKPISCECCIFLKLHVLNIRVLVELNELHGYSNH